MTFRSRILNATKAPIEKRSLSFMFLSQYADYYLLESQHDPFSSVGASNPINEIIQSLMEPLYHRYEHLYKGIYSCHYVMFLDNSNSYFSGHHNCFRR